MVVCSEAVVVLAVIVSAEIEDVVVWPVVDALLAGNCRDIV